MAEVSNNDYLFKEVFSGKNDPANLLTEVDKCQKMFPFSTGEKVGKVFVEAVDLEFEHGFTLGGNDAAPTLRAAISSEGERAEITPSQIIGRKVIGYRDFARSDDGKRAFQSAMRKKVIDLTRGARRNIEISTLLGQNPTGIGVVASLVDATTIEISAATWSPGVWSGSRNMVIDVYQSNGSTLRQGDLTVVTHDGDPESATFRYVTVSGTTTGITVGDIIFRDTANATGTFKECAGIGKILRNTGTLFNVSASDHNLWKANSKDVAGNLTFGKILRGVALGVNKGLSGDVAVLIPTRAYEEMNIDQAALRKYDYSYSKEKALNGTSELTFIGQAGRIMIVPHLYMMEGEAYSVPVDEGAADEDKPVKRIGSVDLTFEVPGEGGRIFRHLENTGGMEFRNYTDQCVFIQKPGQCTRFYGITYPSA